MRRAAAILLLLLLAASLGCAATGRSMGEHIDDAWISTKTRVHLMSHGFGPQLKVEIEVLRGVVTLRGTAATQEQKEWAERAAREVTGVRDVVNEIRVAPPEEAPARRPGGATAY